MYNGSCLQIVAKTFKGKGIEGVEDKDGCHGKPVPVQKIEVRYFIFVHIILVSNFLFFNDPVYFKSIEKCLIRKTPNKWNIPAPVNDVPNVNLNIGSMKMTPNYKMGDKVLIYRIRAIEFVYNCSAILDCNSASLWRIFVEISRN